MINMIGTAQTMTVIAKEEEAFVLEKRGEQVKLPFTNAANLNLAVGDMETVFIYRDYDHEIVATTIIPKIQVGRYAWGTVTDVRKDLGVFVDIGIPKDVVVSMDDMPALNHLWPKKGDRLMIALRVDEKERIWGVLGEEHEFKAIATKATQDMFNKNVTGTVYRLLKVGTFVITEDFHIGFIHESERTSEPRVGEKLEARVIAVKPDGTLNLSLRGRVHEVLSDDAEMILTYLRSVGGKMPFGDKSDPDAIRAKFGVSKAQFKRALGTLMKERRIKQEEGFTYLIEKEETPEV
ncbi:CvfB family protein [Listeria booriae]|uniref:S1 RNA-binding domain-containing protein n=1 Tax=Listeria booriae TaxID=1552123 RepID=A0A7X0XFA6_9LIST|nr:S1 RNA-binding domain-containing protein [Listeria booriae]MBC1493057.1 S1 RNA-binding domain-containing protein [Listeria booriae]MBC1504603.1 S1 RNA-binding domain-containing protein [Listeria booriae]